MCRAVTCKTCAKPTWAGCGNHVDQALAGVPRAQRCPGHTKAEVRQAKEERAGGGWMDRLFGR